jgi:hypothetical protein
MYKILIIALCSFCLAAASMYGQPSAIANDKINVFYIGLDNPISVAVAGVENEHLIVEGSGDGITISQTAAGKYNVRVSSPKETTLTVKNSQTGKVYAKHKYQVKEIPMPIVSFCFEIPDEQGIINLSTGAMKAQLGVLPYCPNIALDIKITVISYTLSYTKKRCPAVEYKSTSAKFEGDIANAIKSAEVGEIYVFKDIVIQILGEPTTRLLNPLTIRIK